MSGHSLNRAIEQFLPQLIKSTGLTHHQIKVLRALKDCRTTRMGGSAMACTKCGAVHYVLHSCRNRHCPRCQSIDKELWVEARKNELLPVKYYHVVFTVPHDLLELFRFNKEVMYNLLFEKAWQTLKAFARDPQWLGAKPGAMAILHTWDQQMKYHPHVHFIVPAGGLNNQNKWVHSKQNGDFLFDVKMMSSKFSAIFVKKLRRLKMQGKIKKFVPRDLIKGPWAVYAKQAFGSPENVIEYLGRYTHRVAISNARVLKVTDTNVTFRYTDRRDNYKIKTETLTGVKFLKRFVQHILPPGFRRIRYLGFLGSKGKKKNLQMARKSLGAIKGNSPEPMSRSQMLEAAWGTQQSLLHCKHCGGELVIVATYPRSRAPPNHNSGVVPNAEFLCQGY